MNRVILASKSPRRRELLELLKIPFEIIVSDIDEQIDYNNDLVKEIEKAGGVDFSKPVLLGYTGLTDVLLQKYISDSSYLWEGHVDRLQYVPICSVIGTHAGPGAVAVAFFAP